jgi:hypothetical protein
LLGQLAEGVVAAFADGEVLLRAVQPEGLGGVDQPPGGVVGGEGFSGGQRIAELCEDLRFGGAVGEGAVAGVAVVLADMLARAGDAAEGVVDGLGDHGAVARAFHELDREAHAAVGVVDEPGVVVLGEVAGADGGVEGGQRGGRGGGDAAGVADLLDNPAEGVVAVADYAA